MPSVNITRAVPEAVGRGSVGSFCPAHPPKHHPQPRLDPEGVVATSFPSSVVLFYPASSGRGGALRGVQSRPLSFVTHAASLLPAHARRGPFCVFGKPAPNGEADRQPRRRGTNCPNPLPYFRSTPQRSAEARVGYRPEGSACSASLARSLVRAFHQAPGCPPRPKPRRRKAKGERGNMKRDASGAA